MADQRDARAELGAAKPAEPAPITARSKASSGIVAFPSIVGTKWNL
jgi:hypothetical protein